MKTTLCDSCGAQGKNHEICLGEQFSPLTMYPLPILTVDLCTDCTLKLRVFLKEFLDQRLHAGVDQFTGVK